MSRTKQYNDVYVYRLGLDQTIDRDIIDWINSFPSGKKAEIVRYALRYYIGQLKDHEVFKLTHSDQGVSKEYTRTEKLKKKPNVKLLNSLTDK